jgi:hypothetical protein
MSETFPADYAELLRSNRELLEGIRMIRRAAERASRAGVLPQIEHEGRTPREECEAIARAVYRAAFKQNQRAGAATLAGLDTDDFSS